LIYADINEKTICMDADQYAGKHYEYHNLYGYGEAKATYEALQSVFPGKRPFVLSRSTFPGSGKYTNHWTGDNQSKWSHLKLSIVGILEFNLFGIPLVGADICGFLYEATEELCVRWTQAGAFYPFSRNHNDLGSKQEQDPAAWSPTATTIMRDVLSLRYGFLPYLYTLLYQASQTGSPVARPLFYDYPSDANTRNVDDQFLWGTGLMVAPVMEENARSRPVYFPRGRWYEVLGHREVPRGDVGRLLDVMVPLNTTALYIRGGIVVPWQNPAANTVQSRKNELGVLVGLDENARANGSLYWDDGESQNGRNSYVQFEVWQRNNQGGIHIKLTKNDMAIDPPLNIVLVYGLQANPTAVTVDEVPVAQQYIVYSEDTQTLRLDQLGIKLDRAHEVEWQY